MNGEKATSVPAVLRKLFFTLMLRGRVRSGARSAVQRSLQRWALMLCLYAVVGLVALQFTGMAPLARSASLHALTMLMVAVTLAGACSQLLFNGDEPDVLLHRPVAPGTLLRAKAWVLLVFAFCLTAALNVAGSLMGAMGPLGHWAFVPVHVVSMGLEVVFCVAAVTLAYGLCLKWFGRERLDGFLAAAQVIVAVAAMLSGRLVPRLMQSLEVAEAGGQVWALVVTPPVWFGAFDALLTGAEVTRTTVLLACLAVVMPLGLGWLAFHRMAAIYGAGLTLLQEAPSWASGRPHGRRIERLLALPPFCWWVREPVERAAFRLTAAALGRARDVRLRVYPQLVQGAVYPVIFFAQGGQSGAQQTFGPAFGTALAGAMAATLAMNVLEMLRYSDHWKGSEMFLRGPLTHPAAVFAGVRKAVLALVCAPLFAFMALALLAWRGPDPLLAMLLPGLLLLPLVAWIPTLWKPLLPLSEPPEDARAGSLGCLRLFVVFGLAFAVALWARMAATGGWLHWLLAGEAVAVALGCMLLRRAVFSRRWDVAALQERF